MNNPLKNGRAGAQIVSYFEETHGMEPIVAVSFGSINLPVNEYHYHLTFSDGSVADYAITYEESSIKVAYAERIA